VHQGEAVAKHGQILIVEDDAAVRDALGELFAREGYDVATANNGAEAIEQLEEGASPCVVLVDLLMPGIVGHELIDYMQREERVSKTPVAIITGSPYLAPKGYAMFPKPLDTRSLLDFVGAHCPIEP
jgi:CheY-like chemotaxis protein